jgi:hypothetical protein
MVRRSPKRARRAMTKNKDNHLSPAPKRNMAGDEMKTTLEI